MIKRIDIRKFGSFNNFSWTAKVRDAGNNVIDLKAVNIVYGRNYSGKTTLSRIVRSLETKLLPRNFEDADFRVYTDAGEITQGTLAACTHIVRVYNKDFVDDNLGFLRDPDGKILPIAVVGAENNQIETDIEHRRNLIGSEESKTGLKWQQISSLAKQVETSAELSSAEKALEAKLTAKANNPKTGIKHNKIYNDANYNALRLKKDIEAVFAGKIVPLTEEERVPKISLLGEAPLDDITTDLTYVPLLDELVESVSEILKREISPQKPIQELMDDANLQDWVRTGIGLHDGKRTSCGFCGEKFQKNFWSRLRAHFDEQSEEILAEIQTTINSIITERGRLNTLETFDFGKFYADLNVDAQLQIKALGAELKTYLSSLALLESALRKRQSDIFKPVKIPAINDNSEKITANLAGLKSLTDKNNARTATLGDDQKKAVIELRLSEVAQFMVDSGYNADLLKIEADRAAAEIAATSAATAKTSLALVEGEIDELQKKLRDEKRGAEKVNEYLRNFFGHNGLSLEASEEKDGKTFQFQIMRADQPAHNLSEGECSLVAFCYFIAKLEDTDAAGKELIVYIDDPISSLDNNHIFFVYSLICSTLSKEAKIPLTCKQLFISTHNLEFLKLLKRVPVTKHQHENFLITGAPAGSAVSLMPHYLRNYVTEFNFLFEQICLCTSKLATPDAHACFYNFGNNMRKFLECYLFFKYPFSSKNKTDNDHSDRIKRFFDQDGQGVMVQRLSNEYSHLCESFDRSVIPVDRDEIAKVADFVLLRLKEKDPEQFESLLISIELDDPLIPT